MSLDPFIFTPFFVLYCQVELYFTALLFTIFLFRVITVCISQNKSEL